MRYINISLGLFILSMCLFFIARSVESIIFIIAGVIIQLLGLAMLLIGGFKRYKESG